MKQATLLTIALVLLVLLSLAQAFQLNSIKAKIKERHLTGSLTDSSSSETPLAEGSANRKAELPASIKNLPRMVGGC
jgi:Na+/H+-dicarboxylate symporter